jgi:hypothetical protein
VFSLSGGAGKIVDYIKKVMFHGHPLDFEVLTKGLGSVQRNLAVACHAFGLDLDAVAQLNIEKLRKRYPEGFDPQRSQTRIED